MLTDSSLLDRLEVASQRFIHADKQGQHAALLRPVGDVLGVGNLFDYCDGGRYGIFVQPTPVEHRSYQPLLRFNFAGLLEGTESAAVNMLRIDMVVNRLGITTEVEELPVAKGLAVPDAIKLARPIGEWVARFGVKEPDSNEISVLCDFLADASNKVAILSERPDWGPVQQLKLVSPQQPVV